MHPAMSVIFFTVMSGAGYGLFAIISMYSLSNPSDGLNSYEILVSCSLALVLITAGLISSTFHLANPKNAWRALSRYKTSWLAREGVLALGFYPFALLYMFLHWQAMSQAVDDSAYVVNTWLSLLVALWAIATVFSTGMIYACLKTIRQWNTALTPINYILLGLMLGGLLFLTLHHYFGKSAQELLAGCTFLIVSAAVAKIVYYFWIGHPQGKGPSINTATSFTRATVRLLDVGHTAGTFLTDEFGFRVPELTIMALRWIVLSCAFFIPALLIWLAAWGEGISLVIYLALFAAFLGVVTERWLFFAEARHVVNLYHGSTRV